MTLTGPHHKRVAAWRSEAMHALIWAWAFGSGLQGLLGMVSNKTIDHRMRGMGSSFFSYFYFY
jgi:hypothetical protein